MILYGNNKIKTVKADENVISLAEIGNDDLHTTVPTELSTDPSTLEYFNLKETKTIRVETSADTFSIRSSNPDVFECKKITNCSCNIINKHIGEAEIIIRAKKEDHSEARLILTAQVNPEIELPDTILELDSLELITIEQGVEASFAVSSNADKISANAEDTTIIGVSIKDKTVKLIALKPGNTTVTVSAHAIDSNPVSKTVNVNVIEKPNLPEQGGDDETGGGNEGSDGSDPDPQPPVDGDGGDPEIPEDPEEIDPDFSVDHEEPETELTIEPSSTIDLKVEDETIITAITNASTITAESDSEHVEVQVEDKTVTVLGISAGSANITIKAKAENHKEKSVSVACNVTEKEKLPTDLTISPESGSVTVDETIQITATTNASTITALSESEEHATVNVQEKTVTVTGKKAGSANIIIKAQAEDCLETSKTFICTVNDKAPLPETDLSVEPSSLSITEGKEGTITATTSADSINAESNSQDHATVRVESKNVIVTGVKQGSANVTIRATAADHTEKTIIVPCTINAKPETSLTIEPTSLELTEEESKEVTATTDAETIEAISDNDGIVTASVQGKTITVNGVSVGNTIIRISAEKADHSKTTVELSCNVKDKPKPPTELTLSSESGEVFENETVQITATTNANTITAESDNISHATVEVSDKTITIRGVSEGLANINVKATAVDSLETTKTYTCTVNKKPATDLELNSYSGTFEVDTVVEVTATTSAETITAESNNTDYATVEVTGKTVKITGTGAGNATISIKATAAGKTETVKTYEATITPSSKPATTISLTPSGDTTISATDKIEVSVASNGPSRSFKYYSSDEEVLKILTDECWGTYIYVQGIKPGNAVLHVSAQADGSAIGRAKLNVTVTEDLGVGLPANHVFRYYGALPNAGTGQSVTTYVTESEGVIEATSENPSIAYPNITKGKTMAIQGVAKGNTVINGTITAPNRAPRTFKIYVSTLEDYESESRMPELSLTLNEKSVSVPAGQEKEITFTTDGSYVNAESIKCSICEARVEGNKIIIKANNPGTTTVHVFSNKERSQEASDSISVTVTPVE